MHPSDGLFSLSEVINLFVDVDGILAVIDKMLAPSEDMGREERVIRAGYFLYKCAGLMKSIFFNPHLDLAKSAFQII